MRGDLTTESKRVTARSIAPATENRAIEWQLSGHVRSGAGCSQPDQQQRYLEFARPLIFKG